MKKKTKLFISSMAFSLAMLSGQGSTFAESSTSRQGVKVTAPQEERLKLVGTVISSPTNRPEVPGLPGGLHSSSLVNLEDYPEGTYALKWVAPEGITFDVYRGLVPFVNFPLLANIKNGVTTDIIFGPFHIVNPEGATEDFEVKIYAVY
ncbi:hypothetical protein M1E11_24365 (plasmid) [Bacillus sp. JZ8]|jgi:hypothetical protein